MISIIADSIEIKIKEVCVIFSITFSCPKNCEDGMQATSKARAKAIEFKPIELDGQLAIAGIKGGTTKNPDFVSLV